MKAVPGATSVNPKSVSCGFTINFLRPGLTIIRGKFIVLINPPDFFNERLFLRIQTKTFPILVEDNFHPPCQLSWHSSHYHKSVIWLLQLHRLIIYSLSMKSFKKTLRRVGFIVLMLLAAVAVGVTGSAPIWPKNRERHIEIEVVVEIKEDSESAIPLSDLVP